MEIFTKLNQVPFIEQTWKSKFRTRYLDDKSYFIYNNYQFTKFRRIVVPGPNLSTFKLSNDEIKSVELYYEMKIPPDLKLAFQCGVTFTHSNYYWKFIAFSINNYIHNNTTIDIPKVLYFFIFSSF